MRFIALIVYVSFLSLLPRQGVASGGIGNGDASNYLLQFGWDSSAHHFFGLAQVGLYNTGEGETYTLVGQVGLFNNHSEGKLWALSQCCVVNMAKTFCGLAQAGAFNYISDALYGGQLGLLNLGRSVYGFQVGLVNYARELRGVQIGLVNVSRSGGLPVSVIANAGF